VQKFGPEQLATFWKARRYNLWFEQTRSLWTYAKKNRWKSTL